MPLRPSLRMHLRESHTRPRRLDDAADEDAIRAACDERATVRRRIRDQSGQPQRPSPCAQVCLGPQAAFRAQVTHTDTARIRGVLRMDADATLPSRDGVSHSQWCFERDHKAAQTLREKISRLLPVHVCTVCAMYKTAMEVEWVPWEEVPNIHLLHADGPRSADCRRCGHTTMLHDGVRYCLLPFLMPHSPVQVLLRLPKCDNPTTCLIGHLCLRVVTSTSSRIIHYHHDIHDRLYLPAPQLMQPRHLRRGHCRRWRTRTFNVRHVRLLCLKPHTHAHVLSHLKLPDDDRLPRGQRFALLRIPSAHEPIPGGISHIRCPRPTRRVMHVLNVQHQALLIVLTRPQI